MRYVFLIYLDPDVLPEPDTPELLEEWARYDQFTRETGTRQVFETADALQPSETSTTVRVRNDETLVTDGPFAETKEQLAGFYVLHCEDIDEALTLASKIPGARHGVIEVRPVVDYGLARDPDFLEAARAAGRR
ncbi:MAG: YciI family protein [Gaiellaceae bacterium]